MYSRNFYDTKFRIYKGGVNYPCWYMSVLFWGSLLIYIMLKYVPKTIDYIIMCALPVIYSSYSNVFQDGKMEIWYTEHGVYIPLIRGLADLSLGVLIYYVYKWITKKQFYKYKIANWIIEILCIISIFILTIYPKNIDFLFVIVICILVIAIMSPNSICEKIGSFEIIRWLSQYEYAIYLNHAVIIMFFKKYIMGVAELRVAVLLIFIMVLVTMYSIFTTKFINFVVKTVLKVLKRM